MSAKALEKMAAVAESAATTKCLEEPNTPNANKGNKTVYKPATEGMPAIRAYPNTCGMVIEAREKPATPSCLRRAHPWGLLSALMHCIIRLNTMTSGLICALLCLISRFNTKLATHHTGNTAQKNWLPKVFPQQPALLKANTHTYNHGLCAPTLSQNGLCGPLFHLGGMQRARLL